MNSGNVSRRVLLARPVTRSQGRAAVRDMLGGCAALRCDGGGLLSLRGRRWCQAHAALLRREREAIVVGCGCDPACDACEAFASSGKRVILVGERYNLGGVAWRESDWQSSLRFLVRIGAFRVGASRARLVAAGVRWDFAMNLLQPDAVGSWDARRAREVAGAVRADLLREADLVVLLGTRVREAFGFREPGAGPRRLDDRFLGLPHPSGRCRYWNGGATAANLVRTTFREALLGGPPPSNERAKETQR